MTPEYVAALLVLCILTLSETESKQKSEISKSKAASKQNHVQHVVGQTGTATDLICNINTTSDLSTVTITWRKATENGRNIIEEDSVLLFYGDKRYQIQDSGTRLRIWYLKPSDAGEYECKILADTLRFILTLKEAYAEIIGGGNTTVKQGSPLRLSCILHNLIDKPTYIFWFHDGKLLNYALTDGAAVRRGVKGSELFIPRAEISHEGNYSCVPSNARHANVTVNVDVPGEEKLKQSRMEQKSASQRNFSNSVIIIVFSMIFVAECLHKW